MGGYEVVRIDDIPELDDGRCPMRPVRHAFGITSFGVTAWTARKQGDRLINEHDEADDGAEELYLVTSGRAVFELGGERQEASVGTFVFAGPDVKRSAFAEEAGTTVVVVGGVPGKPYVPAGWELWSPIRPLYEAGDYAESAKRGREVLATNPGYALLFYNVACCESLIGEPEEAIEHLRRGIELSEEVKEYARRDPDLDALRDQPAFKELVAD